MLWLSGLVERLLSPASKTCSPAWGGFMVSVASGMHVIFYFLFFAGSPRVEKRAAAVMIARAAKTMPNAELWSLMY